MNPAIPAMRPHSARLIERAIRCRREGGAAVAGVREGDVVMCGAALFQAAPGSAGE
ncbi:hypothetical protein GCM10010211_15010 [Streptomyces albospinus]|uniref:Uncharacterized protein n=1 Tax=Streptomyces albospinus TaxID=285515 RepID=A0ABQ2UU82_9ACTN|nr:hypothetical protein GCM10010211_15010 [Streptomyces albospinus]